MNNDPDFSVAIYALLYGDYPELHRRLADSLLRCAGGVRTTLWCNQVCPATRDYLADKPFQVVLSDDNVPKYKAMRRLFAGDIPERWVVWFDDDSFLDADDWLPHMRQFITAHRHENVCYIGELFFGRRLGGIGEFVGQSKWYRGRPPATYHGVAGAPFVVGAYWWLRTDVLRLLDWPDERLNHNGGDTLLGEALWQQQLPLHPCTYGAVINAAGRRGLKEPNAGLVRPSEAAPAISEAGVARLQAQAVQFHQAGRLAEAAALYRRVLQTQPQHADATHLLGVIHLQRGQAAEAVRLIRAGLLYGCQTAACFCNLAVALRAARRFAEAVESARQAVRVEPDYQNAHKYLGLALLDLQRPAEAAEALRRAVELNPRDGSARQALGLALRQLGVN